MASETKSRVDIELRVQADRAMSDIRRAEAPVRRAAMDLERRVSLGLGAGAANSFVAGIGAGGGKAVAAKVAGIAALFAAIDQGIEQVTASFKDPTNRQRSFGGTAFEGIKAGSASIALNTPILGKVVDLFGAVVDHTAGRAPGAGMLDAMNMHRRMLRAREESVRALGEPAVPDRFGTATPFGAFIGGGAQTDEATTLLRQIAQATTATARTSQKMQRDSEAFR